MDIDLLLVAVIVLAALCVVRDVVREALKPLMSEKERRRRKIRSKKR